MLALLCAATDAALVPDAITTPLFEFDPSAPTTDSRMAAPNRWKKWLFTFPGRPVSPATSVPGEPRSIDTPSGPDGAGPDDIGSRLPGSDAAFILADQPRAARQQYRLVVKTANVLANKGPRISGQVGIDRGFQDGRDQRARDNCGARVRHRHRAAAAALARTHAEQFVIIQAHWRRRHAAVTSTARATTLQSLSIIIEDQGGRAWIGRARFPEPATAPKAEQPPPWAAASLLVQRRPLRAAPPLDRLHCQPDQPE